jgi:hypothetical protein
MQTPPGDPYRVRQEPAPFNRRLPAREGVPCLLEQAICRNRGALLIAAKRRRARPACRNHLDIVEPIRETAVDLVHNLI